MGIAILKLFYIVKKLNAKWDKERYYTLAVTLTLLLAPFFLMLFTNERYHNPQIEKIKNHQTSIYEIEEEVDKIILSDNTNKTSQTNIPNLNNEEYLKLKKQISTTLNSLETELEEKPNSSGCPLTFLVSFLSLVDICFFSFK
ncbi:hypothetical protein [uncultured Algibacter sp.]|uniref:hypothetical protein n=1 Tax=uncultured Algibacter sp. TaxID=298659 RepID=UPI002632CB7D|nr:hypothetical protein [uncultured Algibacter sp.]